MGEKDSVRYTEKLIRDRFYFRYTLCHHGALADGGLSLYSERGGDNDQFPLSGGSQPDHVCILQGQPDNADTAGNGDGG